MSNGDFDAQELYEVLEKLADISEKQTSADTSRDYSILISIVPILGPYELAEYQGFVRRQYIEQIVNLTKGIAEVEEKSEKQGEEIKEKLVKVQNLLIDRLKEIKEDGILHYQKAQNEILDEIRPLCSQSAYDRIEKVVQQAIAKMKAQYLEDINMDIDVYSEG